MTSAGPNFASSASGTNWSNQGNLYALDTAYCTYDKTGSGTSDTLTITGFGFAIPSGATILGVVATIRRKASVGSTVDDYLTKLVKAGAAVGSNKAALSYWSTSDATVTRGGAADLWGTTWTPAEVNANNFGIQTQVQFTGTATASIDSVELTIYYATSAGPNNPSAATGWTNSGNIYASDNSYATFGHNNGDTSPALDVTGFGFAIPGGATIDGVVMTLERSKSGGIDNVRDNLVKLLDGGAETGNSKADTATNWPSSDGTVTYGGASDVWGTSDLTAAKINASNFGVRIKSRSTGFSALTARIDHVTMTVYYTASSVGPKLHQLRQQGIA